MGVFDSLTKIGQGALGAFGMSGPWDADDARDAAMKSYKRTLEMSNTAVQRRKADLISAGFNPLLAVGQAASAGEVGQANVVGALAGGHATASNLVQLALRKAQTNQANSAADANRAAARKADAEAEGIETTNASGGPEANVELTRNRSALAQVERELRSEEVKRTVEQTALTGAQTALTVQERERSIAATDKLFMEMKFLKASTTAEWNRAAGIAADNVGKGMDNAQKRATLEWLIETARNDLEKSRNSLSGSAADAAKAKQMGEQWNSYLGEIAAKWNLIFSPITTAATLAR